MPETIRRALRLFGSISFNHSCGIVGSEARTEFCAPGV